MESSVRHVDIPQSRCQNRSSVLLKLSSLLTGRSHLFLSIPPTSVEPRGKMWLLLLSTAMWWLSPSLLAGASAHLVKMKSWRGHLINVLEKDRQVGNQNSNIPKWLKWTPFDVSGGLAVTLDFLFISFLDEHRERQLYKTEAHQWDPEFLNYKIKNTDLKGTLFAVQLSGRFKRKWKNENSSF